MGLASFPPALCFCFLLLSAEGACAPGDSATCSSFSDEAALLQKEMLVGQKPLGTPKTPEDVADAMEAAHTVLNTDAARLKGEALRDLSKELLAKFDDQDEEITTALKDGEKTTTDYMNHRITAALKQLDMLFELQSGRSKQVLDGKQRHAPVLVDSADEQENITSVLLSSVSAKGKMDMAEGYGKTYKAAQSRMKQAMEEYLKINKETPADYKSALKTLSSSFKLEMDGVRTALVSGEKIGEDKIDEAKKKLPSADQVAMSKTDIDEFTPYMMGVARAGLWADDSMVGLKLFRPQQKKMTEALETYKKSAKDDTAFTALSLELDNGLWDLKKAFMTNWDLGNTQTGKLRSELWDSMGTDHLDSETFDDYLVKLAQWTSGSDLSGKTLTGFEKVKHKIVDDMAKLKKNKDKEKAVSHFSKELKKNLDTIEMRLKSIGSMGELKIEEAEGNMKAELARRPRPESA